MEKMTLNGYLVIMTNYCTTKADHNRLGFESSDNSSRVQSTEKLDAV